MKSISILISLILLVSLNGCKEKKGMSKAKVIHVKEMRQPQILETTILHEEQIAKFTISALMNQSPEIMDAEKSEGLIIVKYNRPDDGQFFDYKVKINGNNIVWGNANGRWRDTRFDEKISFNMDDEKVIILQTFNDGSKIRKEYNLEK